MSPDLGLTHAPSGFCRSRRHLALAFPAWGSPTLPSAVPGAAGMLMMRPLLELGCRDRHDQQGCQPERFKASSEHTEKQGKQTPQRSVVGGSRTVALSFLVAKSKRETWWVLDVNDSWHLEPGKSS